MAEQFKTSRPTIREGDVGKDVMDLMNMLPTYYFDSSLTRAVKDYQRSRGLEPIDGVVGPDTWGALESNAPPYVPPGLPPPLDEALVAEICQIVEGSDIAGYEWDDRGRAPLGYTKGVALAFANTYRQYLVGYPPAVDMAKANSHNASTDVLSWYLDQFNSLGMDNSRDGPDTLRHLWVFILGLGMRESSGEYCCGRDQSASNTSSNTCEAGAWQTSYDAHGCSKHFDTLFDAYLHGERDNPQGFEAEFAEGVSCSSADWQCYGSGDGYLHQEMSKYEPAYAAQVCAITLRHLRQHYGPVNRQEVEIIADADDMLRKVAECVVQRVAKV